MWFVGCCVKRRFRVVVRAGGEKQTNRHHQFIIVKPPVSLPLPSGTVRLLGTDGVVVLLSPYLFNELIGQ